MMKEGGDVRLVITHEQPDFDALASVALATVLYPGAVGAVGGQLDGNLTEWLRLYRDQVALVAAESVDLDQVRSLVVVDTAERGRVGRFTPLLTRVPVTVYDHHPAPSDPIPSVSGLREEVGATVTLLCRRLEAEGVMLAAPIATVALLGLHEDTGDLTFDHVTADDHRAAAYLFGCGAQLDVVRRFRSGGIPAELTGARAKLLLEAELCSVHGRRIAIGCLPAGRYVHGVSALAGELLRESEADAAIVLAPMDGKTLLFARAEAHVDVACALQSAFAGGGHARAAFARTPLEPAAARTRLLAALHSCVTPPRRARDIMSRPVRTVAADARLAEARELLALHHHNGMPVVDAQGRLVGVISRRDIDHALRHQLGDAAVAGFMTRPAITAPPDATLQELENLILAHDIGRLPIVIGTSLAGIVTRTDLVRARHPAPAPRAPAERVLRGLPEGAREVVAQAVALAGAAHLYLVGGSVRDGLLGVGTSDLDFVVEGMRAADLARALQGRLGGSLALHPTFGTATVTLTNGLVVDLTGARSEAYDYPGALPSVREGDLAADLARRDFSVNAVALRLHPEPLVLIDPFGGVADLEARRLRVLHPLSFVEDPTRLVRGARLAGRLGLRFDADTVAKAEGALRPRVVANVSGQRLRAELELTLHEARVAPALRQLDGIGALGGLYGFVLNDAAISALDEVWGEGARREATPPAAPDAQAYLLVLLASTPDAAAQRALARFHWPQRLAQMRERIRAAHVRSGPLTHAQLTAFDPSARRALGALAPHHRDALRAFEHAAPEPRLRGRDVVSLGLAPGPAVGRVLSLVDEARARGDVRGFAAELVFARAVVSDLLAATHPPPPTPEGH
jgi:tRNA nucleotidyltransferase (CCA-adding enzyme)